MLFQGHEVRYGIDKVEFVSKASLETIKEKISPLRPIKKDVGRIDIVDIKSEKNIIKEFKNIYKEGFRTIIRLTNITPALFDLIIGNEILFGKPWLVEIFQDVICDGEHEAIALTKKHISYTYLKYIMSDFFLYDRKNLRSQSRRKPPIDATENEYNDFLYSIYNRQKKKEINKDIIGDQTLYLNGKLKNKNDRKKDDDFNYVLYARLSKKDKKPVMHHEFRLKGWYILRKLRVRKKTGTSYFETLKNLTGLQGQKVFNKIYKESVKLSNINTEKLSRYHLEWSNKKKFTESEKKEIQLYLAHLKNSGKPNITAFYMKYFEKYEIDYRLFTEQVS